MTRSPCQHSAPLASPRRLVREPCRVRRGSAGLCAECTFVDCAACFSSSGPSDCILVPVLPLAGRALLAQDPVSTRPSSERVLCNCLLPSCSSHQDCAPHALPLLLLRSWNAFQLSVPFLYHYGNHNPSLIAFPPSLFSLPTLLQVGFAGKLLTGWSSSNFPHKQTAEKRESGGGAVWGGPLREATRGQGRRERACAKEEGALVDSKAKTSGPPPGRGQRHVKGSLQVRGDGGPRADRLLAVAAFLEEVCLPRRCDRPEGARTQAAVTGEIIPNVLIYRSKCL